MNDFLDTVRNHTPNNAQLQEMRRRMNQRPAISDAQDAADTGISDAATAQDRADAAHERSTNPAIDAAHARAEASYKKDASEPATHFRCNGALGGFNKAFVRYDPPDGDDFGLYQLTDKSFSLWNDTSGVTMFSVNRTGTLFKSGDFEADNGARLKATKSRADAAHARNDNAAIHAAHTAAENAQTTANQAHSRNTNGAIDAAHDRADAAYNVGNHSHPFSSSSHVHSHGSYWISGAQWISGAANTGGPG